MEIGNVISAKVPKRKFKKKDNLKQKITVKPYPTYTQSIILILIWLLSTIVSVLIVIPFTGLSAEMMEDGLTVSAIYTLSMVLTVVAGLFLRGNWRLATNPFPLITLLYAFMLIIGVNIVLDPLTSMAPVSDVLIRMMHAMRADPLPFLFVTVIAAPVLEELTFRGIILDGYLKNYRPMQGILISALLFGLIHGNLTQGIGAGILGIIFGWVYWRTGSIIPVIFLHFANNGLAFAGTLMTDEADLTKSLRETMGNDTQYYVLYALCVPATIGLIYMLNKTLLNGVSVSENNHEAPVAP